MRTLGVGILLLAAACGGDDAPAGADAAGGDAGTDASACPRVAGPADGPRTVVVSLPYTDTGAQADTWRLLTLDAAGALTPTDTIFTMGRAFDGSVTWTPDGQVGLVAQDDGSLGVFRVDGGGVAVVHARFTGGFYASAVVMDPGGALAYVVDGNWRDNGGGIYRVAIGCDGALTDLGRWFPSKLAAGLHLRGDRALLVARDVAASPAGDDVHLLDWTQDPPALLDGADAFGDDEAIVGGSAVTADGRHALIGDISEFSGIPNRVATVRLDGDTVSPAQLLSPVEDPLALVASPDDDAALVVSGYGDALLALGYAPTGAPPFTMRGALTYTGARPELPGHAVMIERGALRGLVLVAETVGVRRVRFAGGGAVTDLGKTSTGAGTGAIVGAIGVQP